MNRLSKINV